MAAPIYYGGNPFFRGGIRTKFKVVASASAAVQLTRSQSNSEFLFDRASGVVYTLPTAVAGLTYTFAVTVTVTTNTYKVITKNATEFLIGVLTGYNTASNDAMLAFNGDGSSHIAVTQNSASTNATGGQQGSYINFTCMSATLWMVSGTYSAGTTATTPFAAS